MDKVKVLCVMTDAWSVAHFRIGWPATYIRRNHSDEIEVHLAGSNIVNPWDIAALSQYDIIHVNRQFGLSDSIKNIRESLNKVGVKVVIDTDDHWDFPKGYENIIDHRQKYDTLGAEQIYMSNCDYATTTTEYFKQELLKLNPNVEVLPNGIDLNHKMWDYEKEESDVVRIAWAGSIQRLYDLKRLEKSIQKLYADPELKGKFVFYQFGGEERDNEVFQGPGFEWFHGKSPWTYGEFYAKIDISLAPLEENLYNRCKSEIKMVEAGMNKIPFICQAYGPYIPHIQHGKNGLMVTNDDEWYIYIKELILNPERRKELGQALHDYVNPKFSMKEICRTRIDFYKRIANEG